MPASGTADKIVLVDTSAWICYFARKGFDTLKASIAKLLDRDLVAITGPVLIELVQGCRTVDEKEDLKQMLEGVLSYSVTDSTWRNAAELGFNLRRKGVTISAIDAIIATVAVDNKLMLAEGKGRKTPAGTPRSDMIDVLRDLEASAMLKRTGVWAKSNADKMLNQRSEQRSEDNELKEIQSQVKESKAPHTLLDLNKASKDELLSVSGIGPVLAERIIAGRPYKSIDDLQRVKGIGKSKLEKMRPYFKK